MGFSSYWDQSQPLEWSVCQSALGLLFQYHSARVNCPLTRLVLTFIKGVDDSTFLKKTKSSSEYGYRKVGNAPTGDLEVGRKMTQNSTTDPTMKTINLEQINARK